MGELVHLPVGRDIKNLRDRDVDVEETAIASIEAARVRRFVRALPEIERRVIRWRYGLGCPELSFQEIADRLGMGKTTVFDVERRAIEMLRGFYEQEPLAA